MTRVPLVSRETLSVDHEDLVVSSLQPGKEVNVYRAIANNPAVLAGFREFLGALWSESGLSDRQREVVILTVAAETRSAYEWHQHVNIATGVGLDSVEITALARGIPTSLPVEEQALIAYTRAVVHGCVTDVIYDAVADLFDANAIVGVTVTAAGYLALSRVIHGLDVQLEAGDTFVGWDVESQS
ncbi:carboxymuconolactone decarboxylase family protein [Salinigranum sp. GCM10025319]|uniref:carboxymuconolactone decarboxylase family protein n=1 Tax=Salinigranum sp. GCM10025319 TaxID=3252687 RepID=UPI003609DBF4